MAGIAAGPAPAAISCPGVIAGREPPFSERGIWPGPRRPVSTPWMTALGN